MPWGPGVVRHVAGLMEMRCRAKNNHSIQYIEQKNKKTLKKLLTKWQQKGMFTFRAAERRPRKRLLFLLDKGAHAGHKARAAQERSGSLTSEERVGREL